MEIDGRTIRLVPLRVGTKPIGLLAAAGRPIEAGTLDALGGVVAIAIERAQFLEERKAGELTRQSEELKTALLASLGHDLRTPLTAIRVAATNIQAPSLTADDRLEQSDLILAEVERLTRLFQNILEMARIDAGAIATEMPAGRIRPRSSPPRATRWSTRCAGTSSTSTSIRTCPVRLDPRLTATALAHLLENAAQYAPPGSTIDVHASLTGDGLAIAVRDHGPGIAPADLPHLFERFYRGDAAKTRASGTGMGLWIARGLLAVEQGRIWAENCQDGGAQFTDRRSGAGQGSGAGSLTDCMTPRSRILLVDDEVAIQRAVGPLLRSRGYDVDIAGTGADALQNGRRAPAGSDRPRSRAAGPGRHRGVPAHPGDVRSCRSSCSRRAAPRPTRSTRSISAPTTTSPSRLVRKNCWRASAWRCAASISNEDAETGHLRAGDLAIDYDRRRVLSR